MQVPKYVTVRGGYVVVVMVYGSMVYQILVMEEYIAQRGRIGIVIGEMVSMYMLTNGADRNY
jgi:hypothetical protein